MRLSTSLAVAGMAAASLSSTASADVTQKIKAPVAGDASIAVTPLKPNGGKPTVRIKNKSSLPSSLIVLGGVGKHNGKTYGTIVVVNRKAASARAAQLELIFVGYHRALKGKGPPGVANSVINNTAAANSFNRLCKSGSGIFNYAIDYLKPKPLLGNLFGGYASQAIGKFVAKDACDKAYPQKGKFQGDVNGCPANPRSAFASPFTCQGGGPRGKHHRPTVRGCVKHPGGSTSMEHVIVDSTEEDDRRRSLRDASAAGATATVNLTGPSGNAIVGDSSKTVTLDANGHADVIFTIQAYGDYTFNVTVTGAGAAAGTASGGNTVKPTSDPGCG